MHCRTNYLAKHALAARVERFIIRRTATLHQSFNVLAILRRGEKEKTAGLNPGDLRWILW